RQILGGPEHLDAMDDRTALLRVVVDEAAHVEIHVAAAHDLARGEDARPPGADEERLDPITARGERFAAPALRDLVEVPAKDAESEYSSEREDGPHQDDGQRNAPSSEARRKRQPKHRQDQPRPERRIQERLDLAHPDVAPDEAVDAGERERGELDQDDVRELE